MKTILVTGGAGFIGSNFIRFMLEKYPDYKFINVDCLTYAGNLNNLQDIKKDDNYKFYKVDITNKIALENIFKEDNIDWIVNFAAESHVDRSIDNSAVFLETNVIGTQVLLDLAKKYWHVNQSNAYKENVKFLQVSTDEVYGSLETTDKFNENSPLLPNNPYSASKASADLMVRAYHKTYGLPVNITRCSNNYGPYQFPEKLIPLVINNCINNKNIPVYGDGLQIRDWLHVNDHCLAIDAVLHKGTNGQVYNIGGNNEKTNIEVIKLLIQNLNKSESLIKHIKDRLGHDRRYSLDCSKITNELGWKPNHSFELGIKGTINWYLNNKNWIENVTSGEYEKYYQKMYE